MSNIFILIAFVCALILYLKNGIKIKNDILAKYVGFMCVFNVAYSILHGDTSYITRIIFSITAFLFLYSITRNNTFNSLIRTHTIIITIQTVLAIIAFTLFFLGILPVLSSFSNIDNRICFSFGISFSNIILGPFARMSGYFDEPGALAFWGIYALLFNQLFIKNKIIEYCLIVGLISTLSMAYFISLAMYILFFKTNRLKAIIPFAVGLSLIIFFSSNFQNDYIYKLTYERFENAVNGQTSRTELTDLAYSYFVSSPLFGNGAKKIESIEYMADNPYELPAKDGIVGTMLTYLLLFIAFFRCKDKNVKFSVIILLAGYLQRPFHVNLMHYLILYMFFIACENSYGKNSYKLNNKYYG